MELKKTIVLITPGQPSVNPRIVKEADALAEAGYAVTMLYCFWVNWAQEADKKILSNAKWQYQQIGGVPGTFEYFITKVQFRVVNFLYKYVGNKWGLAEKAQTRCFQSLLRAAKGIKADWYIGHNLGALAVAVKAAQHNNAKAGFDFEDYHRAENESMAGYQIKRIGYLEENYVPALEYISTASPLITDKVKGNFPLFKGAVITLLNAFPLAQQPIYREETFKDKSLQLFWFSQTVGGNRGLEILIDALKELGNDNIHLTLAGRYTDEVVSSFRNRAGSMMNNIHFPGIIPPDELPSFASKFDVGLALEPAFSINNDIALSNKIFTYLLAGNALLVSETSMQKMFVQEYKIGLSFPLNDIIKLKSILEFYLDRNELDKQRNDNWKLANRTLNWENESKKMLTLIN